MVGFCSSLSNERTNERAILPSDFQLTENTMSGTKITYVTEVPPPPKEVIIIPTAPPPEPPKPPNPTVRATTRMSYFQQRNRQMCVQNAGIPIVFFTDSIKDLGLILYKLLFSFLSAYLWGNGPG